MGQNDGPMGQNERRPGGRPRGQASLEEDPVTMTRAARLRHQEAERLREQEGDGVNTYRPVEARDLRPGDLVLVKYYDHTGTWTEVDVPVETVTTRRYGRGSRIIVTWGKGWGEGSYPPGKIFGVTTRPVALTRWEGYVLRRGLLKLIDDGHTPEDIYREALALYGKLPTSPEDIPYREKPIRLGEDAR